MRLFLLTTLFVFTGTLYAQQKVYISPSAGILSMSDESVKNMFYSEVTAGYRLFHKANHALFHNMSVDITAGYGKSSVNDLYILALALSPGRFSSEKLFIESSIGGGLQKMDGSSTRGIFFLEAKSGYYITPAFGIGIGVKGYVTKKSYSSTIGNLFLAFRF